MSDKPVLYTFRRCPYAMRARLALRVAGIEVEAREINLRDKPMSFLATSPKGTVPVLVMADGILEESLDIMRFALQHSDPLRWLSFPQETGDALIARNDTFFKQAIDGYRYQQDKEPFRCQGRVFLQELNDTLIGHGVCGTHLSMVDMAILPFVRQFAIVDWAYFQNLPYPRVQRWLDDFLASSLFEAIMQKHSYWQPQDS